MAAETWGHYEKALRYSLKSAELTGRGDSILNSGFYSMMGDYETALEYARKRPPKDFGYLSWGVTFHHLKQYDSAAHYYKLFADYANTQNPGQIGKFYAVMGELHLDVKRFDSALIYLNRALSSHKKTEDNYQVMLNLRLLATAYKENGAYEKAMQTARELSQMANATEARQCIRDAHLLLYQLFEQKQKKDSAYAHLQQYIILKDSIDLDLAARKLLLYKVRSKKELEAQTRISVINEEKKLQQQQLKQSAQQKNFLIAGSIALLLIAVVVFRNISLRRKNEKLRLENELKIQQLGSGKNKSRVSAASRRIGNAGTSCPNESSFYFQFPQLD